MAKKQSFLAQEKLRQAEAKKNTSLFSEAAQPDGPYTAPSNTRPNPPRYPFCLPLEAAEENLYVGVRDQVDRFSRAGIPWHKGVNGKPTTHLCSSQVCCVNFLAPFAEKPEALLALVQPVFPDASAMVPVAPGGDQLVEFEWIGDRDNNYLDEGGKKGRRTRGANCTSADAAVRYRQGDGSEHVVLIEWKYCESYRHLDRIPLDQRLLSTKEGRPTKSANTRRSRYEPRLSHVAALPPSVTFDDLCVEPLYQLMRQQLLAHEMETAGEAATVSVLHLSPRANDDFPSITSPTLESWAEEHLAEESRNVLDVWSSCLETPSRFTHMAIEDFFAAALADNADLKDWAEYVRARYSWVE